MLIQRLHELAQIGLTDEGICRVSGTPEDQAGRDLVVRWMLEDGLEVRRDAHDNIIGRLPGEGPPIVTGSHIDTVPTAGMYDGALGVLAGLEAARDLRFKLRSPLEVIVFNDEETTMNGSIGYCLDKPDVKAFVELHVEQGPVLDVNGSDIGVVQGIVGQRRCSITMFGEENHAGTTPMSMRNDALVHASELVQFVHTTAFEYDGLVATVGELNVHPNSFSVIPGRVDLTLQVRDLSAEVMEEFVDRVAKRFDLRIEFAHTSEPAQCNPAIMRFITEACDELELSCVEMPSRASHDAQNFTFCPMAMVFVPSIGGISHSPKEETSETQCRAGARILTETIRKIDVGFP